MSVVVRGFFFALIAIAFTRVAIAVDTPANLRVDGVIAPSSASPRVPAVQNDKVLVINAANGTIEAVGEVVDGNGTYFVMIGKDSSFNNTLLTLHIQKADQSLHQLMSKGRAATFHFQGSLFPSRLNLALEVGPSIGTPTAAKAAQQPTPVATGATGGKCDDSKMDVNGDGVCDQADIEIIKAYIAGQVRTIGTGPRPEDVNGDGVVNSRDLIDAMRSIGRPAKPKAK